MISFDQKETVVLLPNNKSIGEQCRILRLEKGLTLQQLANRSGYSVQYLSKLERGDRAWSEFIVQTMNQSLKDLTQEKPADQPLKHPQ